MSQQRLTLAPKRFTFRNQDFEKGNQLLREAQTLNMEKKPFSSAMVLRAFIELTLEKYVENNKLNRVEQKNGKPSLQTLPQKAEAVIQHMTRKNPAPNKALHAFRRGVIEGKNSASIQSLNDFVHGKHAIPTPADLRAGWEYCVPVFEAAYGRV